MIFMHQIFLPKWLIHWFIHTFLSQMKYSSRIIREDKWNGWIIYVSNYKYFDREGIFCSHMFLQLTDVLFYLLPTTTPGGEELSHKKKGIRLTKEILLEGGWYSLNLCVDLDFTSVLIWFDFDLRKIVQSKDRPDSSINRIHSLTN